MTGTERTAAELLEELEAKGATVLPAGPEGDRLARELSELLAARHAHQWVLTGEELTVGRLDGRRTLRARCRCGEVATVIADHEPRVEAGALRAALRWMFGYPRTREAEGGKLARAVAELAAIEELIAELAYPGRDDSNPGEDLYQAAAAAAALENGWIDRARELLGPRRSGGEVIVRFQVMGTAETIEKLKAARRGLSALSPMRPWRCACGWKGETRELRDHAAGHRVCPGCGASGGLDLDEIEALAERAEEERRP